MMLQTLVLQVLVGTLLSGSGTERFEAARRLLRSAHERDGALGLLQLARDLPDDPIAPEALFQAAQVFEEQLLDPETADRLYAEVAGRYSQSRVAKRALSRHEQLSAGLRTGVAPLLAFNDIVKKFVPAGLPRTIARLNALLRDHSDFALADQAMYLLGSAYKNNGQEKDAERTLLDLLARYPRSTYVPHAQQLLGDILLGRREYGKARSYYVGLRRHGESQWQVAAAEGEAACDRERLRWGLAIAAVVYLLMGSAWLLFRGRGHLWPLPFEVYYYAPVSGFLYLVAVLGTNAAIRKAVLLVALGGTALTWLSAGAARAAALRRQAPSRRWAHVAGLVVGAAGRALGVAALCYVVVYGTKLTNVILYTIHDGPEG